MQHGREGRSQACASAECAAGTACPWARAARLLACVPPAGTARALPGGMGRRADVLDAESSAQLSRFQCEVLSWSFYDLGGAADAARQAQLRDVPASFASFQVRGAWAARR